MKKFRNDYKYNYMQVTALFLLLVCVFVTSGCSQKRKFVETYDKKLAVIYDKEIKKGERDGAHIDSLNIEIVKKLPNGDYVVAYTISGQITQEYWRRDLMLKKIRLIEEDNYSEMDSYDKRVILTPVQCYFFGKANMHPQPFCIKNEYLVKNNSDNPVRKILFSCGKKEYLLELL